MSIVNLQDEPIYCRSPYIIEVNETSPTPNTGSKIELSIWNFGTTQPTQPTYVLSKLIPSPTNLSMVYNISHYVKEYITWVKNEPTPNQSNDNAPSNTWCYVEVKRYFEANNTPYTLIDTKTYIVFDGYGYYEEGYNPQLNIFGLQTNSTYEYFYDPLNLPSSSQDELSRYGALRIIPQVDYQVRYSELGTSNVQTVTYSSANLNNRPIIETFAVYPPYAFNGNKVEYLDDLGVVLGTWTFKPKEECHYTPVICDFVNKLGAWQRVVFFKVSKTSINTTSKDYNLYSKDLINYNPSIEQKKVFNMNGTQKIKVNTDWVDESFNETVLKPLMLSEVVRLNNKPVKLITKSTELFESINTPVINYQLEFEYAYQVINNVV